MIRLDARRQLRTSAPTADVEAMGRRYADVNEIEPVQDALDVRPSQLVRERKRADALLAGQRRVIEMLATGASMTDVLATIVIVIEELSEGLLGSVLVRRPDGESFQLGVAPSLPSYIEVLEHASISPPYLGPCGMAADRGEPIVTTNIATDPRWSRAWRELASGHGLRTCLSTPIVASDGEVLGSFGMYHREPRTAEPPEPQLLETATHLAAIAIEYKRAEEALEQADRNKNEFLAMLAHELRNPLAPIRNALRILRLAVTDTETIRTTSAMIERQVDQMVRLVDDLLDVSRISRGRIELRRQRVELRAAVSEAVEVVRSLASTSRHELTVTLPSQAVYVDADPTRLAQVLSNLLCNACKFTDAGGHIWVTVAHEGQQAVVRVRDTGIGIPREQLPRVFDMFAQVDKSLERTQGGLGLGLTLVKSLVELHGGSVHAYSRGEPGQGSELMVRLPVMVEATRAPRSSAPEPPQGEPAATNVRRILVVDDNQDAANSLAMLLRLMGNDMRTAHDGLQALEVAEAFAPHVILLDIGLPKLNGYEVSRRIRSTPWGKAMVLIALTGFGQDEDRRRSQAAGFQRHLVKPVDHETLAKLLTELAPTYGARVPSSSE
jgi:signal transduction histidine kinase/ActR/RegA family two-component response regulator